MTHSIRQASRADLDLLIDWAAAEGWNPGIEDAEPFWRADPEGHWVAEREGLPVAAISLVRHGEGFAFLGFYIAHPDFRGQGIAWDLWQFALNRAGARVIGLDGVAAQQDNYRKSGFAYAHGNIRFTGRPSPAPVRDPRLLAVSPIHSAMLADYDARFNPVRRDAFITEWVRETDTRQTLALMRDGEVRGFGTIRQSRQGHRVGPLFADSDTGADLLFRALVAAAGAEEVSIDIPAPNAAARALCARHGLSPAFETARMYRGDAPDLPLNRIYGITTFELG